MRFKSFAYVLLFVGSMAALFMCGGCQAPGSAPSSACTTAQNTYNYLSAAETTAQTEVTAEQAAILALPATDPARKALEGPLAKAQTVLAQMQTYLTLAKIGVMTLCPSVVPSVPVASPTLPVSPPSTAPLTPTGS